MLLQPCHASWNVVAALKLNAGKVPVMLLQSRKARYQSVTALVSGRLVVRAELLKSICVQP